MTATCYTRVEAEKWLTLPTPYDLMKKCVQLDMNTDETKAIEEEKHRFIRLYRMLYGGFSILNDI
jgi:hypothetical protein